MSLTQPASPDLGQIFPASCPCANTSDANGQPCDKVGVKACSGCFLVLYCSKECQTHHWKKHKIDCKSELMKMTWVPDWEKEQRQPSFVEADKKQLGPSLTPTGTGSYYGKKTFLWGNMPALDVLKLDRNEGADYGRDLNLLFAASGDIRNAIKSITGVSPMSSSQQRTITAVINDRDFDVVARNAILLLAALYVKPAPTAAAAMLHVWYSAFIPSSILQVLRTTVLPLIQDVCVKVVDKAEDKLLAKAFTQGPCNLRLVLEKRHWVALLGYLDVPDGLTKEDAKRARRDTVLAETRKDYRHKQLLSQIPG